jgi:hypothetical protein
LPVRDSLTVPPIQSVVGPTGTGVALGCAALGLRTALVDVIGDDMEGRLVQDRFASAGVELATATHPSGTRRAVNLVTPDGSRMSLYDPRPPVVVVTDGAHGSAVHRRDESPLRVPGGQPSRSAGRGHQRGRRRLRRGVPFLVAGRCLSRRGRPGRRCRGGVGLRQPGTHTGLVDEPTLRGLIG